MDEESDVNVVGSRREGPDRKATGIGVRSGEWKCTRMGVRKRRSKCASVGIETGE
jgi:hypothetical protein